MLLGERLKMESSSDLDTWCVAEFVEASLHTVQHRQPLRMIIPRVILRQPPVSERLLNRRGLLEASSSALKRHGRATWKKHCIVSFKETLSHMLLTTIFSK